MAQENGELASAQYLSFTIAKIDYGVPIVTVKEILQFEEATCVPGTPRSIRGVINVRGQVVPVVDLAVKFGHPETVPSKRTCVLVVETACGAERLTMGVLTDAVNEVVDLPPSGIEPPPTFGENVRVDYLTGIGKIGKHFLLLLDTDRVLSASEAEIASQIAATSDAAGEVRSSAAPVVAGAV